MMADEWEKGRKCSTHREIHIDTLVLGEPKKRVENVGETHYLNGIPPIVISFHLDNAPVRIFEQCKLRYSNLSFVESYKVNCNISTQYLANILLKSKARIC